VVGTLLAVKGRSRKPRFLAGSGFPNRLCADLGGFLYLHAAVNISTHVTAFSSAIRSRHRSGNPTGLYALKPVETTFKTFPGEVYSGRVEAVLPATTTRK
jgi:hypothetical protein